MNKKTIMTFLIATTMLLGLHGISVTKVEAAEGVDFSIEPIYTRTQIDSDAGFYYLTTEPGKEQTLEVKLLSSSEEQVKLKIEGTNAFTQGNGQMSYTSDLKLNDPSLVNPVSSLLTIADEVVTLDPYEVKTIKVKLTPPKESYPGVKAGALEFTQVNDDEKSAVGSITSYRIGVLLSETGDDYHDAKKLILTEAKATQKNSKKVMFGTLQNPDPKVLNGLDIDGTIIDKKSGKVIKKKEGRNYSMAPNSKFDFEFDWGIERIKPGEYTLKIQAENGSESWQLQKDITVSGEQAKKINESSPYQLITPTWTKVITVTFAIATLILSILIMTRKKQREDQWKKLTIDKKRKKKGRRERREK